MENPTIRMLDEEMLRKSRAKYGPVMEPVPPKRYKFKRTLICSPTEMKMIEEAKRERLARETEEAATGIKRQHFIAYSAPDCYVDLSQPFVSDVPPPSFQWYLDTYQDRMDAALAAAEARAAALAARPRPHIKLMLRREHEAAGTKVQAECLGAALERPCDDSNSETHADLSIGIQARVKSGVSVLECRPLEHLNLTTVRTPQTTTTVRTPNVIPTPFSVHPLPENFNQLNLNNNLKHFPNNNSSNGASDYCSATNSYDNSDYGASSGGGSDYGAPAGGLWQC